VSAARDPSSWLELAAGTDPRRTLVRTPEGRRLDYGTAREQCARLASALLRCGAIPGDRVALRVEKSPEAVLVYLACLRIGAVFVPLNPASTPHELEYLLGDSGPRIVIVGPGERAALAPLAQRAGVARLETLAVGGEGSLNELADSAGRDGPPRAMDAAAPAAILYTSGTTGRSKGAILTRGNLASNAAALVEAWRFTGEDVLLHVLPLSHVHGLFAAINTVLASASGMLLLPRFEVAAVLSHLAEVSVFMGVPTYYTRLLKERALDRRLTERVRLFVSGSAPLLAQTHEEFRARTGQAILERFGMTETLMNTSNPYDGPRVPGSVGPPLPGVAVRVTDRESGAVLRAPDAIGTLEISGPNVFAGYWRDAAKTRDSFTADGWFKTGDLGRIDERGYVYIVGRVKDLIISGGYNVYPKEVEAELDALAGIAESAVFGVPHADYGEGVTAAVVLEAGAGVTEADILALLRAQLAGYKLPKRILIVPELPRNALGKVQKNILRSTYAALYAG